jgi:hypothetical protein
VVCNGGTAFGTREHESCIFSTIDNGLDWFSSQLVLLTFLSFLFNKPKSIGYALELSLLLLALAFVVLLLLALPTTSFISKPKSVGFNLWWSQLLLAWG